MIHTQADKKRGSPVKTTSRQPRADQTASALANHRPDAAAHQQLQVLANSSPQVHGLNATQKMADTSPRMQQIRQHGLGLHTGAAPVQRQTLADEAPLQDKLTPVPCAPRAEKNRLPAALQSGIESLSGLALGSVKVHYNSAQPAQLNAHAYAQGSDIHLAPGQERHLPHEAWHVVQQRQGRVKPTLQRQDGVPVNDNVGLEKEADVMGARAVQTQTAPRVARALTTSGRGVVQQKGRIDMSAVPQGKQAEIENRLQELKAQKRQQKKLATSDWAQTPELKPKPKPRDKNDTVEIEKWRLAKEQQGGNDDSYNSRIQGIRQQYEQSIKGLAKDLPEEALVSGDAYYGTPTKDNLNVYKRADNHKEYVKDMRGTFVPRYVRRELNRRDPPDGDLSTTGINDYETLSKPSKAGGKGIDVGGNTGPLSWEHREFIQQSNGGGGNQFALSHTSTKRPILSNDHKSFGEFDNGSIVTDLSKIKPEKIAAQWQIDPVSGHKVRLGEDKHKVLGDATKFKNRDSKVRQSGYRNAEVLTESVPLEAIVHRWDKATTDTKESYKDGESERGKQMKGFREDIVNLTEPARQEKIAEQRGIAKKKRIAEEERLAKQGVGVVGEGGNI